MKLVVMADMLLEFENENGKFVESLDSSKYFYWTASKVLLKAFIPNLKESFDLVPVAKL